MEVYPELYQIWSEKQVAGFCGTIHMTKIESFGDQKSDDYKMVDASGKQVHIT